MFKSVLVLTVFGAALATAHQASAAGLSPNCAARAPVKAYDIATGEWDTVFKDRQGAPVAYRDRGQARAANSKLERYTFDPSQLVVKKGDCVVLRIHDVKGSHHNVTVEGTAIGSEGAPLLNDKGMPTGARALARANPNTFEGPERLKDGEFVRGELVQLKFQANEPGTYRMICEVHTFVGANGEARGYDDAGKPLAGPMVGYIVVLP